MPEPAAFYTELVADLYGPLRSVVQDPEPYARFIELSGQPALELGCGDGDPLLDLLGRGLEVEGVDSSADMLERCRRRAVEADGVDPERLVLHHQRMEDLDLGDRCYRTIFLAGPTFNLLADDDTAGRALGRIHDHLEPGGNALVPLFVPEPVRPEDVGKVRAAVDAEGRTIRFSFTGARRDEAARRQDSHTRYERGDEVVERDWTVHWHTQPSFRELAAGAGLTTVAVLDADGEPAPPEAGDVAFWLTRPAIWRRPPDTELDGRVFTSDWGGAMQHPQHGPDDHDGEHHHGPTPGRIAGRHPDVARFLAASDPVVSQETAWGDRRPIRLGAHVRTGTGTGTATGDDGGGRRELPDELVTSVRCIVRVDTYVVVCQNAHDIRHVWPGGHREAGETYEQTACREVLEETGWLLDPTSLVQIGWLHVESLGDVPPDHPYPHPDSFHAVFEGRARSRAGSSSWVDVEGYERSSELVLAGEACRFLGRDPMSAVFLEHLLAGDPTAPLDRSR